MTTDNLTVALRPGDEPFTIGYLYELAQRNAAEDGSHEVRVLVHGVPDDAAAEGSDDFAKQLGQWIAGRTLYFITYWQEGDHTWAVRFNPSDTDNGEPGDDEVRINAEIENQYELYRDVTSYVWRAILPAPPADGDIDTNDDWESTHLRDLTGVGNLDGDSWYDGTITASSNPDLVGTVFQFGY